MANRPELLRAQRKTRTSKHEGTGQQPQGVGKKTPENPQPTRRSARISALPENGLDPKLERRPSLSTEYWPPPLPPESKKRYREVEQRVNSKSTEQPQKRLRPAFSRLYPRQAVQQDRSSRLSEPRHSHISHWAEQNTWPTEYFEHTTMHPLLARPRSMTSLRRKRSDPSIATSATPSDQRPREEKSAPYGHSGYPVLLQTQGDSYMRESELGISDASKALCNNLLEAKHPTPKDSLFRDDAFPRACRNLQDKNEARIILDIARLLVPSPEALVAFGAKDLDILVESVNEGWNNSVPVTIPRPQPDFSVCFGRSMFSDGQLSKLEPLLGDFDSLSYLMATWYMYFPFFTSEVKRGATGLDIADRQNSHSNTLAVRGYVELFRLAKRESELHREIVTFSVSHDHRTVRLYGYYPIIDGSKTRIYRHEIDGFDIAARDGKEKWRTYQFVVALYNHSLTFHKRLCSVIDELPPDCNLNPSQSSGGPQENQEMVEVPDDNRSSNVDIQQEATPNPSTLVEKPAPKRKNKKGKG